MNFLAHLYLSPPLPELRLGGFIADSVKGSQIQLFPESIQKGIVLHREIDSFTDSHPIVLQCKQMLRPHFRLYSGVVLDIYFDHFLAKNWTNYANTSLHTFVKEQYLLIETNKEILPERIKHIFVYMKKFNWLENYKDLLFLNGVFKGMSKRTPFVSNMQMATKELKENYLFYQDAFFDFFPEVCQQFHAQKV